MSMTAAAIAASVREIWLAESGCDEARGADNFFALGGESLGAAAVLDAVNRRLGIELGLRDFYRDATLDALTERALRQYAERPAASARSKEPGVRLDADSAAPSATTARASIGQEWALLFTEHPSQQDAEPFLVQEAFHLRGPLDLARVQRAMDRVVQRHELLRSTFRRIGEEVYLKTEPDRRIEVLLSALDTNAPRGALRAEAERAFDRYAAPAARCRLFQLTPDDHVLVFVFDHLIADGGSVEILLQDFADAYAGRDLPAATMPFTAWATEQRSRADNPDRVMGHWRDALGADPSIVATPFVDYRRPKAERADGVSIALTAARAAAVTEAARRLEVTTHSLMLGSFLVSLRDRVRRREFCVVTTSANRTARTARTFGPIAHDVYIPVDLTPERDLATAAGYAHRSTADSLTHAAVPSTAIAEALWPQAGPEIHLEPAFYFSANRTWSSRFRLDSVRSEEIRFAPQVPMPGVECTLEHDDRSMTLNLRWLADSFPLGYVHALGEEAIRRVVES